MNYFYSKKSMVDWLGIKIVFLAAICVTSLQASAESFDTEENFDDDTHFEAGASLPAGWSISDYDNSWDPHFSRQNASDYLGTAQSGSYVISASSNGSAKPVLYTPKFNVAGGVPFTVEFYAQLPAGTPPAMRNRGFNVYAGSSDNIDDMTLVGSLTPQQVSDWTQYQYSYTPEEDGEYRFAIEVIDGFAGTGNGSARFDTFFFHGQAPSGDTPSVDIEPNPDNISACVELPYTQNFSDASQYDGGFLPIGWVTVGTVIWRTANIDDLPAYSGEYYMVTPESSYERDERAYTPFFNLTAGVEYTFSFMTHFDGYQGSAGSLTSTLNFTVGSEQDADFHTSIYTVSRVIDTDPQWVREEVKFTPSVSGPYCFSFLLSGSASSGYIAVDDFRVTSPVDTPRPEPAVRVKSFFNFMDSNLLAFAGKPVHFVNQSQYADSYEWSVDGGAEVSPLEDGDAEIIFPASGEYKVVLTATNGRGSRTATNTVNVTLLDGKAENIPVLNFDPGAVKYYDRGYIPYFDTDADGLDYVSGFNHYYYRYAERYDLPDDWKMNLRLLATWLTNYRLRPVEAINPEVQATRPLNVTVYGVDEDGNLDENHVLGQYTSTIGDVFGTTGIGQIAGEVRPITFDQPIQVEGSFYLAIEFSKDMIIDVTDVNIGRSFFSLGMLRHYNDIPTFYVQPYAVPDGCNAAADGKWYPVGDLNPDLGAMGMNWQLWSDLYDPNSSGITSVEADKLGVHRLGDTLIIDGISRRTDIAIYDFVGRLMFSSVAEGTATVSLNGLPEGVYIVKAGERSAKFIK